MTVSVHAWHFAAAAGWFTAVQCAAMLVHAADCKPLATARGVL